MNIRAAISEDIPSLMELERTCGTGAHWTQGQYRNLFEPQGAPRIALVAESAASLLGFLVAQHVAREWELENIVVAVTERRKGIGSSLLNALLEAARQKSGICVSLEVRESNHPARRFYESADFKQSGKRKSYYSDPPEDALLYRMDLP